MIDSHPYQSTIYAAGTAPGRAGIAVLRISGPQTQTVLAAIFGRVPPPRRLSYGAFSDPATGEVIDRGLAVWLPGPNSFTGEDMAEFHGHGSRASVDALLHVLAAQPGCHPAMAGEFTKRALLAGKLTLDQVEGLGDLLAAETELQRRQAMAQLDGGLSLLIGEWCRMLVRALALLEASIDFPDEDDVADQACDVAREEVRAVSIRLRNELAGAKRAQMIREGFRVALIGMPNAGKSSLLNALARRPIAIVSPVAGTTRDTIEVALDIDGLKMRLIDTAGVRDSADAIEQEGVRRALSAARTADAVVVLHAADQDERVPMDLDHRQLLHLRSKIDLRPDAVAGDEWPGISSVSGQGIDSLLQRLRTLALEGDHAAAARLTRARHHALVARACAVLDAALARDHWGREPELAADACRQALLLLGEVNGQTTTEAVLDELFSSFCIGK